MEYGADRPGQVIGGRWKPLHYLYTRSLYADVMATCGNSSAGTCYVKNDRPGQAFDGVVTLQALEFASGVLATVHSEEVSLSAGPGESHYFQANLSAVSGSTHMLIATVAEATDGALAETALSVNEILLATPKAMRLPAAEVTAVLAASPNAGGSHNVTVTANATALFVTLTTRAHGRFSDNFFVMAPGSRTVAFVPFPTFNGSQGLAESLRVEHLQQYM